MVSDVVDAAAQLSCLVFPCVLDPYRGDSVDHSQRPALFSTLGTECNWSMNDRLPSGTNRERI